MPAVKRTLLALVCAWALALALPGLVRAHTELIGSEPADGASLESGADRVRLSFNEPIEPEFYSLQVFTQDRARVDRRDARVPPDNVAALEASLPELPTGVYTVVWRVLSIDGHVVRGVFSFTVGAGVAPTPGARFVVEEAVPTLFGASVRWWTFLASLILVGGFLFVPLALRPAAVAAKVGAPDVERLARRFLWVAWPSVILLFALGLAGLVIQAAEATGTPLAEVLQGQAVTRLLVGTKYGALWLIRTGLVIGVLFAVVAISATGGRGSAAWWAGALIGAATLLTISAGGHASAVPTWTALVVGADWLHLLAAAVWTGGLAMLALVTPSVARVVTSGGRRAFLAALVRRFSVLAGVSVAILVGSGLYASLIHVPSWQALLDTAYGAALSGKLILFVPLIALGAVNLLVLGPRFVRAVGARRPATGAAGLGAFRAVVLGEVALVVAVLAVTGLLTILPPATTMPPEGQPFRDTQVAGGRTVELAVTPNQAGTNTVEVAVRDAQGRPASDVGQVTLAMSHLQMEMGERRVTTEPLGEGRFRAQGGYLSMTGPWRVEARVATGAGEEAVAFDPTVGPAPGTNRPAVSPARILLLAVTVPGQERASVNLRVVAALIVGAVGAWVLLRLLGGARLPRGAPLAGGAALLFGLFLFGTSVADAYRRSLPNPMPADAASIARGKEVYEQQCAACHGVYGRGDGLAGRLLRPRPADFRVHLAAGHTDPELFGWITDGVDGTGMPAFRDSVAEEDRWHVINYIRALAEGAVVPEATGSPGGGGDGPASAAPPPAPEPAAQRSPIRELSASGASAPVGQPVAPAPPARSPAAEATAPPTGPATPSASERTAASRESGPLTPDAEGKVAVTLPLGDLVARLTLTPRPPVFSDYEVALEDALGRPYASARRVAFKFAALEMNHGVSNQEAVSDGAGRYRVSANDLVMTGTWQGWVVVELDDGSVRDARFAFQTGPSHPVTVAYMIRSGAPAGLQLVRAVVYPDGDWQSQRAVAPGTPVRVEVVLAAGARCGDRLRAPALGLEASFSSDGFARLQFGVDRPMTLAMSCEADGLELRLTD